MSKSRGRSRGGLVGVEACIACCGDDLGFLFVGGECLLCPVNCSCWCRVASGWGEVDLVG